MKISNVVNQLAKIIPQVSPFFSETIEIASISGNGSVIAVETTANHNLITGEFVSVVDVTKENPIASFTFSEVNGQSILAIETTLEHDLTLHPKAVGTVFAQLADFTDSAWNASLEVIEVSNRNNFKVVNGTASDPALNGNELLLEIVLRELNGPQEVTVVDATNFTYPSSLVAVGRGGSIQTKVRIAGVVNFERAVDQYTRKDVDNFFMFVAAPASVTANKSRGSETDVNNEATSQNFFTQDIRDGFMILTMANVSSESGALDAMDKMRDEVLLSILLAVRGVKFPSGLSCEPNQVAALLSHGTLFYDNAIYIHQFIFEQPLVVTGSDAVQPETRAFRDIDFVHNVSNNEDVDKLTASINLDDDPLP